MKKYLNIVALFVCLMSGSVHAEGPILYTFKDTSCGAWAKSAENKSQRIVYHAWIMGFISGYNWRSPGMQAEAKGNFSAETVSLYLDKYCRENPLKSWINGAFELVKELRGDKN